jgi:hypothetical protein
MTDSTYMNNRKQYARPQAILFSENPGELSGGSYVPSGYEIGNSINDSGSFIILSDHNRSPLDFGVQRIENRQRMVNGRMRSYWIADKRTLSVSWDMLPSRSFSSDPNLDTTTGLPTNVVSDYTVDGGAGGAELLDWYEKHYGTFYVFLAYDKFPEFGRDDAAYTHLAQYQEVLEMYITDFTWSVEKRGGSNFDMWNISITLEEA